MTSSSTDWANHLPATRSCRAPRTPCPRSSSSTCRITNALGHIFYFEPCVEAAWHTVLEGHVDVVRPVPLISGDDRSPEATQEFSVLAGQHAVRSIGEVGDPDHLRISLGVLSGVQNEIECFDGADASRHRDAFTPDHGCLQMRRLLLVESEGYFPSTYCASVIGLPHRFSGRYEPARTLVSIRAVSLRPL